MGNYEPVRYERTCEYCGGKFVAHDVRKRYCSKICNYTAYNAKRYKNAYTKVEPTEKECIVCGKKFQTRRLTTKTCSPQCARVYHNNRWKRTRSKEKTKHICIACGAEYETSDDRRKTCGAEKCVKKAKYEREKKRLKMRPRAVKTESKKCVICGSTFKDYKNGTIKTCSPECSLELKKQKTGKDKRVPKDKRVDKISLKALYRRDKGKCYLCGGECDWKDWRIAKSGNGYPGDTYPTKDHVIPVSRGGEESWENVRLAHWKCNLAKSDAIIKIVPMSKTVAYSERYSSAKRTEQYTINGTLIKVWQSTAEIKRTLGLNDKRIQEVCRENKSGYAFGYIWKYAV